MVKYLLKKSYQRKNFKEIEFDDLWNKDGVFTTMWIYNKPPKILFFKTHIDNLIKSLKAFKIYEKGLKSKILKLINVNIDKTVHRWWNRWNPYARSCYGYTSSSRKF